MWEINIKVKFTVTYGFLCVNSLNKGRSMRNRHHCSALGVGEARPWCRMTHRALFYWRYLKTWAITWPKSVNRLFSNVLDVSIIIDTCIFVRWLCWALTFADLTISYVCKRQKRWSTAIKAEGGNCLVWMNWLENKVISFCHKMNVVLLACVSGCVFRI